MSHARKSAVKAITSTQIRRIHTIVSILRISDENYRAALESRFNVTTCKNLTLNQAQDFIRELDQLAMQVEGDRQKVEREKRMEEVRKRLPYSDLDNRPGMATGSQLRKIEATWRDVSIIHEPEPRARALRRFVHRIAGVADLRFLDREGASKVINAVEAMKRNGTPTNTTKLETFKTSV